MSVKDAFGRLVPPTHDEAVERGTIARAAALRLAERVRASALTAGTGGRARHRPAVEQRIVVGTRLASSPRAGDMAAVNGDSLALCIRRDPMNPRHAGSPARGCESSPEFQPRSER